jgi:hypothetical protein
VTEARVEHIREKVATVKRQMRELKRMAQAAGNQMSLKPIPAAFVFTSTLNSGGISYASTPAGYTSDSYVGGF